MARVKDTLRGLDVRPSKGRGQNFLIDTSVIDQIVEFGAPAAGELLIEIGPGLGALTAALIRISPLKVIEIEQAFCEDLRRRFPSLDIINRDVREVDFSQFGNGLVVFGNLPYSYSTEILFHILSFSKHLNRAVFLLQKEFVDRMAATPGTRTYGSLSVACQVLAEVEPGPVVTGNCFHPPTKVDSRMVALRFPREPRYAIADPAWFRTVLRAAFSERRKMLSNCLRGLMRCELPEVRRFLEDIRIAPTRRAETLSIDEFVHLSDALRHFLSPK